MKPLLRALLLLAGTGMAGAGAVVGLGLYDVSARHGHLPGVSWVLHATFRNSVQLRAPPPGKVPPLTDALAALGARHYDAACRHCHGAPDAPAPATMQAMLPQPPPIREAVRDWQPNELGWIVYHGIKMSGMPAWPAPREDEVWPVVAFLERVRGMDAAGYARLTAAPALPEGLTAEAAQEPAGDVAGETAGETASDTADDMAGEVTGEVAGDMAEALSYCAGCHGVDGYTPNPHVPRLDILDRAYLGMALETFRSGRRMSGIMRHAATAVPREVLEPLAAHYARQDPREVAPEPADPALVERGRILAFAEAQGTEVPACRSCHGPWPDERRPEFPALAGQHATYLEAQLRLWRDGLRGGGRLSGLMHEAAERIEDADIAALAAYYAALPPDGAPVAGTR